MSYRKTTVAAARRRAGLALAALVATTASCGGSSKVGADAPKASVSVPLEVYDFTLPNGMRVILDEDKAAPVVAVNVWYKVGSKDDPKGRGGFAHLFEHLMFQGTHSIAGDVHVALEKAGATEVNATTGYDRTEYHETVPSGALEWTLWFESERLATMGERLDQANFERERNVVRNELRERYENVEGGFGDAIRYEALFGPDHPYGHPRIGSIAELDQASLDEVRAFHTQFYQPASAVLTLVGDFDRKQVIGWIQKYFVPIPKAAVKPVRTSPSPALRGEKRIRAEANIPLPQVWVTYTAPSEGNPELTNVTAVSNLIRNLVSYWLVEERKLAHAVDVFVQRGLLASTVTFSVKLNRGADPEETVRVLDKAIFEEPPQRFGSVNNMVNRTKLERLAVYEDFSARALDYAKYDDLTQNPLYLARELEQLDSVQRSSAFQARQKFLQTHDRLVTFVKPNATAPIGGRVVAANGGL